MSVAQLLHECREKGLEIYLSDGSVKIRGDADLVKQAVPVLREHKVEILHYLKRNAANDVGMILLQKLEAFRLDEMPETQETGRINNMAWEFMQADGMSFPKAIRLASEITANCRVATCEAAYEDVRSLWERLKK